jgi:hypothetical protein
MYLYQLSLLLSEADIKQFRNTHLNESVPPLIHGSGISDIAYILPLPSMTTARTSALSRSLWRRLYDLVYFRPKAKVHRPINKHPMNNILCICRKSGLGHNEA